MSVGPDFGSSLTWCFWLRVFHEGTVKMIAGALSRLKPLLGLDDLLLSSLTWLLIGGFGPLLAIGQETSLHPINSHWTSHLGASPNSGGREIATPVNRSGSKKIMTIFNLPQLRKTNPPALLELLLRTTSFFPPKPKFSIWETHVCRMMLCSHT